MTIADQARQAKEAAQHCLAQPASLRKAVLRSIRQALSLRQEEIFLANKKDLESASQEGLAEALIKRLHFDKKKLARVIEGIVTLENSRDPLGRVLEKRELDKGLILSRVAGPIGLIGMIFESRPDALVQIATLCLRSGNAIILKGGSEAKESNRILSRIIAEASSHSQLPEGGLPKGWIQLAETREDVAQMLPLHHLIDLIIPRGSKEFVAHIMRESAIPVLGHADGICHVYVDAAAEISKALPIIIDSKMQYVTVCNAAETLLVHQDSAQALLPALKEALEALGCELRGCERTRKIITILPSQEADWDKEYLDSILSIKIVDNMEAAITHIHRHGSGHTDVIISEAKQAAEAFLAQVDSANVFHNCSTRFADGFVFGLGAEVGISTSKIHARGPVGVEGLLSYRWQLRGSGQIIADYNEGHRRFTHKDL